MIKPDRIVTTTCPYCGVGCNLKLHVQVRRHPAAITHSGDLNRRS